MDIILLARTFQQFVNRKIKRNKIKCPILIFSHEHHEKIQSPKVKATPVHTAGQVSFNVHTCFDNVNDILEQSYRKCIDIQESNKDCIIMQDSSTKYVFG